MPALEGSLDTFQPISVLQLVNLAQATGELELVVEGNSASVFFDRGSMTFASLSNRQLKLGEYLANQGLITRAHLEQALRKRDGRRLGDRLVDAGAIDVRTLQRAIEEQIKDVIYQVIRWTNGRFKFHDGRKPSQEDVLIDIPLDHLVLEGLKRLDEEQDRG